MFTAKTREVEEIHHRRRQGHTRMAECPLCGYVFYDIGSSVLLALSHFQKHHNKYRYEVHSKAYGVRRGRP